MTRCAPIPMCTAASPMPGENENRRFGTLCGYKLTPMGESPLSPLFLTPKDFLESVKV